MRKGNQAYTWEERNQDLRVNTTKHRHVGTQIQKTTMGKV